LKAKYSNEISIFKALEIDFAPEFIKEFDFFRENYELDYIIGSIHYVINPKSKELLFIDGSKEAFIKNLKLFFGGDVEYAVKSYFAQTAQMITSQKPDIIGHIDKIIMNASDLILVNGEYPPWYLNEISNILDVVAANKSILELNMRGIYKGKWHTSFLDRKFLPLCKKKKIDFVVSTDAHSPDEVALAYENGIKYLTDFGIQHTMEFNNGRWLVLNQ